MRFAFAQLQPLVLHFAHADGDLRRAQIGDRHRREDRFAHHCHVRLRAMTYEKSVGEFLPSRGSSASRNLCRSIFSIGPPATSMPNASATPMATMVQSPTAQVTPKHAVSQVQAAVVSPW